MSEKTPEEIIAEAAQAARDLAEQQDIEAAAQAFAARIAAGARRADVVNAASIRNGMSDEEIEERIDKALQAMGE